MSRPCPLQLPRPLVSRLLAQAQASPDEEICGLIAGKQIDDDDSEPEYTLYPIDNIAPDRRRRYQLDPAQQIAAMRDMRERNKPLVCIYHSHPHSPAIPSATDMAEAGYPEAVYLIISLDVKGVIEMRGWRLTPPDSAREISVEVTDFGSYQSNAPRSHSSK